MSRPDLVRLDDVGTAKETLSRVPRTSVHVPLLEDQVPLGREELLKLSVIDRRLVVEAVCHLT